MKRVEMAKLDAIESNVCEMKERCILTWRKETIVKGEEIALLRFPPSKWCPGRPVGADK